MKLFQYWDTGEPPEDVSACIESVRTLNPDLGYRLFDRGRGSWFIGKHLGPRHRRAFDDLLMPAMQADYLRLCVLLTKGGLWNDVDNRSLRPFSTLIKEAPGGFLSMLNGLLQTDFMFVPEAGSAFLAACLELATQQVEARMEGDAYSVTGPMVLNMIWASVDPAGAHEDPHLARTPELRPSAEALAVAGGFPGAAEAFAKITRKHDVWTNQWLAFAIPAYKSTDRDWRRWRAPIYVGQPAVASSEPPDAA